MIARDCYGVREGVYLRQEKDSTTSGRVQAPIQKAGACWPQPWDEIQWNGLPDMEPQRFQCPGNLLLLRRNLDRRCREFTPHPVACPELHEVVRPAILGLC